MSKFYVYCVSKNIDNKYGKCFTIEANSNASCLEIKDNAVEMYGDEFYVCQVVSKNWAKLLKIYNKLFKFCEDNKLFEKCDTTKRIGECCGYDLSINSICNYEKVVLDEYNQLCVNITHLGDEQFSEILYALEEVVA